MGGGGVYSQLVSKLSVLVNVIIRLYQHKGARYDLCDTSHQNYLQESRLSSSALSPSSIRLCLASYRGLSLAPGQGHCIITVQLQGG